MIAVLRKKVEKFERKGMQNYKLNPERVPALDTILNDVFNVSRPKAHDYDVRKDLVRIFNEISQELFGNLSLLFSLQRALISSSDESSYGCPFH